MERNYEYNRRPNVDLRGLKIEEIEHFWKLYARDQVEAEQYRLACLNPKPTTYTHFSLQEIKPHHQDLQITDSEWEETRNNNWDNIQPGIGNSYIPAAPFDVNPITNVIPNDELQNSSNVNQDLERQNLEQKKKQTLEPWIDPSILGELKPSFKEQMGKFTHFNLLSKIQELKVSKEFIEGWTSDENQLSSSDVTNFSVQPQQINISIIEVNDSDINVSFWQPSESVTKATFEMSWQLEKQKELEKYKNLLNPAVFNAWRQIELKKNRTSSGKTMGSESAIIDSSMKQNVERGLSIRDGEGEVNSAFHRQVKEIEDGLEIIEQKYPETGPFITLLKEKVRRLDLSEPWPESRNNYFDRVAKDVEEDTPRKLPAWMPVKEAATVFKLSARSIWRNISEGDIATKEEVIPIEVGGNKVQEVTRKLVDMRELADYRINRMGKKELDPSDPIYQLLQKKENSG
ncbi:MAG: hypothetical protein KDE46_00355 [Caldilineaceae bacterium]|nr:hypothetical protein [Caldilineaceae bacterium]